jgi:hypothetical protein
LSGGASAKVVAVRIAVFHNLPSCGAKRMLYGFVKRIGETGHAVAGSVRVFPVKKTVRGRIGSHMRYIPSTEISLWDLERVQRDIAVAIDDAGYDIVLSEQDRHTMSPFFLKYIKTPTVYFCQQPRRPGRAPKSPVSKSSMRDDSPGTLRSARNGVSGLFARRLPKIDRTNASYSKYMLANSYLSRESILDSYGRDSFVSYLGVDPSDFRSLNVRREDMLVSVGMCAPDSLLVV